MNDKNNLKISLFPLRCKIFLSVTIKECSYRLIHFAHISFDPRGILLSKEYSLEAGGKIKVRKKLLK